MEEKSLKRPLRSRSNRPSTIKNAPFGKNEENEPRDRGKRSIRTRAERGNASQTQRGKAPENPPTKRRKAPEPPPTKRNKAPEKPPTQRGKRKLADISQDGRYEDHKSKRGKGVDRLAIERRAFDAKEEKKKILDVVEKTDYDFVSTGESESDNVNDVVDTVVMDSVASSDDQSKMSKVSQKFYKSSSFGAQNNGSAISGPLAQFEKNDARVGKNNNADNIVSRSENRFVRKSDFPAVDEFFSDCILEKNLASKGKRSTAVRRAATSKIRKRVTGVEDSSVAPSDSFSKPPPQSHSAKLRPLDQNLLDLVLDPSQAASDDDSEVESPVKFESPQRSVHAADAARRSLIRSPVSVTKKTPLKMAERKSAPLRFSFDHPSTPEKKSGAVSESPTKLPRLRDEDNAPVERRSSTPPENPTRTAADAVESETAFFERFSKAIASNSPKKSRDRSPAMNRQQKKFFASRSTTASLIASKQKRPKWAEKYRKMNVPRVENLLIGLKTPSPLPKKLAASVDRTPTTEIRSETTPVASSSPVDKPSSTPSLLKKTSGLERPRSRKSVRFSLFPPNYGEDDDREKEQGSTETKGDDAGAEHVDDIFGFGFGIKGKKGSGSSSEEDEEMKGSEGSEKEKENLEKRSFTLLEKKEKMENRELVSAAIDVDDLEPKDRDINGNEAKGKETLPVERIVYPDLVEEEQRSEDSSPKETLKTQTPPSTMALIEDVSIIASAAPPDGSAATESVPDPETPAAVKKPLHPFFLNQQLRAPSTSTPKTLTKSVSAATVHASPAAKRSPPIRVQKAFRVDKDGKRQMILDLGQKNFGPKQCSDCDMVFTQNDPEDELAHRKFHDSLSALLKFPEWKKQRVVGHFINGKIVQVISSDPKYMRRKVEEIEEVMNQNLGFLQRSDESETAAFFFVADGRIVGCCIAETISSAFRVVPNNVASSPRLIASPPPDSPAPGGVAGAETDRVYYCSREATEAVIGINRIWVLAEKRRQRIATRLLDAVRCSSIFGAVVEKDVVAFTDPTPDGRRLAAEYSGRPDFLVYKL